MLISISTLLRLIIGSSIELGNDEVYYLLYAKFPDLSHFDHPPFVGFFIQFFTFNLTFDGELAIRLAAIIPTSISMYITFLIGCHLRNQFVGFVTVLLYNLSIYGFIISGTFILPDSPMVLFWMLSIYFLLLSITHTPAKNRKFYLVLAFLFIAFALYSKYQAIFLLFGLIVFVALFNRAWLTTWVFYLGFILPLISLGLILYWNYQNDFISFTFHSNRVSLFDFSFNKDSFLRELIGQVLYSNPYIFLLTISFLIASARKKIRFDGHLVKFFLIFSFPLIFTTFYLSFFRNTLPHWSGISYLTLLPLLAVYIEEKRKIDYRLFFGFVSFLILIFFLVLEINFGWISPSSNEVRKAWIGRKDPIMDMYGWRQSSKLISDYLLEHPDEKYPIISDKWFPAAHLDYYIAAPNNLNLYAIGDLKNIHKYYWINKIRPDISNENHFFYFTDSRNYRNPKDVYKEQFKDYKRLKEFPIVRNGKVVKYLFMYKLTKG